jgi:hypothetical protein
MSRLKLRDESKEEDAEEINNISALQYPIDYTILYMKVS